jgi:uncharacterized protein (TIGR00290 family)
MKITELKGKKFAASYSGGKDSVLAIYRAIQAGLVPHKLITTYNTDANRSWFHGLTVKILDAVSESFGIPVCLMKTSGAEYAVNFEKILTEMKNEGVEVCIFGDIDIEAHREWCTERCNNAGITAFFPLWQEERKKLVYEFIDSGFSAVITIVNRKYMPDTFLGKMLTKETAAEIEQAGADICGENGEYHTFTFDGPLFSGAKKIEYAVGEKIEKENYSILPIY